MTEIQKNVHMALQGGGAHGAYTWGVLDKILEDGRLNIHCCSASSAGSLNAAILAHGRSKGGVDGAREALHNFWYRVSKLEHCFAEAPRPLIDKFMRYFCYSSFDSMSRMLSPYEFNPMNLNPLKDLLVELIDFDMLRDNKLTDLYITTTNVRTGRARIFKTKEITAEVLIASASLPYLFQAAKVGEEYYWDGGYSGNPSIFPLFYHGSTKDIVIVHINPLTRATVPKTANEIADRINEVSFNCSLIHEIRSVAFVNKLLDQEWLKEEHRPYFSHMLIHSIRADEALKELDITSKFDTHWYFLTSLRDLGRSEAEKWLNIHFDNIGKKSTLDIDKFLANDDIME